MILYTYYPIYFWYIYRGIFAYSFKIYINWYKFDCDLLTVLDMHFWSFFLHRSSYKLNKIPFLIFCQFNKLYDVSINWCPREIHKYTETLNTFIERFLYCKQSVFHISYVKSEYWPQLFQFWAALSAFC